MLETKIAKSSLMILLMVTTAMAGCIGSDDDSTSSTDNCSGDELKIAYEIKEDLTESIDQILNRLQIIFVIS